MTLTPGVQIKCSQLLPLVLIPGVANLLGILITDGGVPIPAEAGENGQNAASLLSPERLGLMEG